MYDTWMEELGTVRAFANLGSYQGDYVYLIQDGDRWGTSIIGYGSCSGCDAYQAAEWDDECALQDGKEPTAVASLREDIQSNVRWFDSLDEAKAWLLSPDRSLTWWGSYIETEMKQFVSDLEGLS